MVNLVKKGEKLILDILLLVLDILLLVSYTIWYPDKLRQRLFNMENILINNMQNFKIHN